MELQPNMYVRLDGKIGKIIHVCTCEQCELRGFYEPVVDYGHNDTDYISVYWKDNLKASYNIIDLIEVGDYVNGSKVYYCCFCDEDSTGLFIDEPHVRVWLNKPSQIKSIVTKEQFESMQYRIGD